MIAIIGGGPGGLTLARVLHTRGIHAVVYEREPNANVRSQVGGCGKKEGENARKGGKIYDQNCAHPRVGGGEGEGGERKSIAVRVLHDRVLRPHSMRRTAHPVSIVAT